MLGLILVPLTYSTFAPSKRMHSLENAQDQTLTHIESLSSKSPLVKTGYRPPNAQLIDAARKRQAKRERRLKRLVTVVLGWSLFGYMVYLIATTKPGISKLWDPYEILGLSTVCVMFLQNSRWNTNNFILVSRRESDQKTFQEACNAIPSGQNQAYCE